MHADAPDFYFEGSRNEILPFVPEGVKTCLDVGCAQGNWGKLLHDKLKIEVTGIEPTQQAKIAETKLHQVYEATFDDVYEQLKPKQFDLITFNDVLEHLVDPWDTLNKCKQLLNEHGYLIASLPNVRFYGNLKELIFEKDWRYREEGILDKTHLRFFTKKSGEALFDSCGYTVKRVEGINAFHSTKLKIYSKLLGGLLDDCFALQHVYVCQLKSK